MSAQPERRQISTWKLAVEEGLQLSKLYLPRRYVPPPGYVNPAAMAAVLQSNIGGFLLRPTGVDAVPAAASIRLLDALVPTYFVAQEFAEAANLTRLPESMTYKDVNWPAEAALFCLPQAFSEQVFGRHVPFLAYARMPAGQVMLRGKPMPPGLELEGACFLAQAPILVKDVMVTYHHKRPMADQITNEYDHLEVDSTNHTVNLLELVIPNESQFVAKICSLVAKLILLMGAEPTLVEPGGLMRAGKAKHGKQVSELWHPNYVGKAYRHAGPGQGGTHASPRFHFRRGHLHTVLFGPGKEKSKMQWFKPVWVNL